jgi:transcriptional regulator with GAF, ATPase, and Fis domain
MTDEPANWASQLEEANLKIDQQAALIEELLTHQADNRFADDIRRALLTTATAASIGSPVSHGSALEYVVETASELLDSQAASLFLVDEETEELVFVVALGSKAEEVRQFRLPIGRGIAGYVAVSGQPIAISEAALDPRFEREIAEAVDYVPNTILCVPLFLNDAVIGVLELMDKAGGQPFTATDMEILGKFANLAAITIEESRLTHDISRLFRALLNDAAQGISITDAAMKFADSSVDLPENADAMRLAGLVQEISSRGDAGRHFGIEILASLSNYLKSTSTLPR